MCYVHIFGSLENGDRQNTNRISMPNPKYFVGSLQVHLNPYLKSPDLTINGT